MLKELNQSIRFFKEVKRAPRESDEELAWRGMQENVSYRLPAESACDRLIGLRLIFRTCRNVFSSQPAYKKVHQHSDVAILEGSFQFEELEINYVEKQTGQTVGYFISKKDLARVEGSILFKLIYCARLKIFALPLVFSTFFSSKNRSNRALCIAFVAENAGLLHLIKSEGIKTIYDFVPFFVDGNFLSLLVKKAGVHIAKLPSPGPLKTHNHILLGDQLLLSSQYQFEEIKQLPNIRIEDVRKWLPEYAFTYIDRYREGQFVPPSKTIGFYSHGGWLRRSQGHADDGLSIPDAEHHLLLDLAKFFQDQPGFQLLIFPHPREKRSEIIDQTREFYHGYFNSITYQIAGSEVRTSMAFEQCDIGLAAFSTILYERLFCGFKTLIGNYGIDDFPLPGSSLANICFANFEDLENKLLTASEESQDEFFNSRGLQGYRYVDYPYFSEE